MVAQYNHIGLTFGAEVIPGDHTIGANTRTDTAASSGEGQQATNTATAKAQVSNMVAAYLEPTIYFNDSFGIYVKGGVERVTVKTIETLPTSTYGNKGVWGRMWGAGIRATHSSGLFLKLEHVETDYDEFTLTSGTGNLNTITADSDKSATRLAVGYKF